MKLSYDWLQDFVDLSDTDVNTVTEKLTMGAFEVEGIEKFGDKLEGSVVLGEIREISKHPNADKIQITQTCIGKNEDGSDNIQQIVCGARNIAVGQKIPVATVGSIVINRQDGSGLEIKKAKIRGVESSGMLCSPGELGFSEEVCEKYKDEMGDGILILEDSNNPKAENRAGDFVVGSDLRKVLGLKADLVLDVGARSNRGDALSVIGQAREIAALFSREIKKRDLNNFDNIDTKVKANIDFDNSIKSIKPAIEDASDCTVFHTIAIENLKVCESPEWIKQRLEAMGSRPINNVVDVSNYVLYEMGQPTHFYDREKLTSDTLTVKRANNGDKIKTLDDADYELSDKNLIIADGANPVSIAGVMGGFDSQITDSTTSIIIEAAAFTAASVRRSARAAGIESEAKKRFERGVDPSQTKEAIVRSIELLAQIAEEHGEKLKVAEMLTAGDPQAKTVKVELKLSEIKRYLGIAIEKNIVVELLKPLEITVSKDSSELLEFSIPSFRQNDISRDVDLIEEIGRLYGFDKIPAIPASTSVGTAPSTEKETLIKEVSNTMVAYGFSQAILSSLVGDTLRSAEKKFAKLYDFDNEITMQNPLSREHSVLRQSMLPGLIQATSRNYAYDKNTNIKLFELGKIYFKNKKSKSATGSEEIDRLAVVMVSTDKSWKTSKDEPEDFYKLKAIVENLYPRAVFKHLDELKDEPSYHSLCHPGIAAVIFQDKREVGYIAKLHPSIAQEWDLPDHSFILEANLPKVKKTKFKIVSNNPIIDRDITADLESSTSAQSALDLIKKFSSNYLIGLDIVSVYQASPEAPNKSVSFRLKWQSPDQTLSGEEIDKEVDLIKDHLSKDLGAKFRA